jgi:6-phospho-3-hexuloisomerase
MTDPGHMCTDSQRAIQEISDALSSVSVETLDEIAELITSSRRIACYAGGREGLALKGLTMRLFHAGLDVHSVGDMTCPEIAEGDLLILSCGPGNISTVAALAARASQAHAQILYFTAEREEHPAEYADRIVVIDAQTMARDVGSEAVLPMGSSYEIVLFTLADLITNRVRDLRGDDAEAMRGRHTNME